MDTEVQRVKAGLEAARTRFLVATVAAGCVALLGFIYLFAPGKGAIIGLVSLAAAALLLSYALRQRAWRDNYLHQLDELRGGDADETERRDPQGEA